MSAREVEQPAFDAVALELLRATLEFLCGSRGSAFQDEAWWPDAMALHRKLGPDAAADTGYRLWVSDDGTLLVRMWNESPRPGDPPLVEVARRDDASHTWGPPLILREENRVLGDCPHGVNLDRDFCPEGCRV